jgi:hypothetical protein
MFFIDKILLNKLYKLKLNNVSSLNSSYSFQNGSNNKDSFIETFSASDRKRIKEVTAIVRQWQKIALDRIKMAQTDVALDRLQDTHFILDIVTSKLEGKSLENPILYVALDRERRIQGIAVATMYKGSNCLEYLVTHPNNIPIRPDERALRGVGTKLVLHIAKDILALKKYAGKKLHLLSRASATGFYEKLGFKTDPKVTLRGLTYMELNRAGMRALSNKAV